MIENIVFTLADKFPQYDWDVDMQMGMYQIMVNDYDFYVSKEFKKWKNIMNKRYSKNVKFFFCYKNFKHN